MAKNKRKPFQRLWDLLAMKWKLRLVILIFLMFISGFAELITLGSIVPFLAVLVDPSSVLENVYIGDFIISLGLTEQRDLFIFFSSIFLIAIVFSSLFRLVITKLNLNWCYDLISDLSIEAFRKTILQPYLVHLSRNSSELVSGITVKISAILTGLILPIVASIQVSILIISVILALIFILPLSNIIAIGIFSGLYALISLFLRKKYLSNSVVIANKQVKAIKVLQESLAGIRDIILGNFYKEYVDQYSKARRPLDKTSAKNAYMIIAPRFIIEALGMSLIIFLVIFNYTSYGNITQIIPAIGALALGAQRLLPYLQQLYSSYSTIMSSRQSVIDSLELLEQPNNENLLFSNRNIENLSFNRLIELKNISFKYSKESEFSLKNINLKIPKGTTVGIIGTTGGGKSTLLDLLMGLISPDDGEMIVDDAPVNASNILKWQNKICTVPQNIVLTDDSILKNIALGFPEEDINLEMVKIAAKKAELDSFIEDLENKYLTEVGERGVRLSGGQRQRIGIARALYRGGEVMFLDEATNALDMKTEDKILSLIKSIDSSITLFIVAHNIETIKDCDSIIIMNKGEVETIGNYIDVKETASFKRVVGELIT